jgi:hypothetical protein
MIGLIAPSLAGLVFGSFVSFAASQTSEVPVPEAVENPSTVDPDLDNMDRDEPWDGRRYWYCNAAPFRWIGHWDRRDYDAFGRDYGRVHHRAEKKCERFHRRCIVWCERRHQWEWDGDLPGPNMNE